MGLGQIIHPDVKSDKRFSLRLYSPCFTTVFSFPAHSNIFQVDLEDEAKNRLGAFRTFAVLKDDHHIIFEEHADGFFDGFKWKDRELTGVEHTLKGAYERMYAACVKKSEYLSKKVHRRYGNLRWFECSGEDDAFKRKDIDGEDNSPALYYSDSLITLINSVE